MSEKGSVNRRSFVAQVVGAGVVAGGVASSALAQVTDQDGGATADPAQRGRGPARTSPTGQTDSDAGAAADRANYGRGGTRAPVMMQPNAPAPQNPGCRTFNLNGPTQIIQSDRITVQANLSSQPPNVGGNINITGTAEHYNVGRGMRSVGTINGFIRGSTISFRIHWHAGRNTPNPIEETGVYEGTVNSDGQSSGTVYSMGRPRPQRAVTWFIETPLTCVP